MVVRYLTHQHYAMKDNDIFYHMYVLQKATVYSLPQHLIDEHKAINMLVSELMDKAEEQCRKLHTGSITWSPVYKKSCLLLDNGLTRCS